MVSLSNHERVRSSFDGLRTSGEGTAAVARPNASALRSGALMLVLAIASAALYLHRLDYAPPHIEIDEVLIGLEGHSVATTGRSVRGELLPLYFPTGEHSWYQPFVIYLTALVLRVLPLSEWAVRVPTVTIAVLDIVLMFLVARRLFASDLFGAVAAALLALTPAHFIHSRYGMDYVYPVPFILGWLLCLAVYIDRPRSWLLVAGGLILGFGFYSYIASIVMMPVYAATTCLLLWQRRAARRTYWLAAIAFLPLLVPFVVWVARHPAAFHATVDKYALYDTTKLNALQGVRSLLSYASISERLARYWDFFNPAFLFFGSGIKMMFSTNLVGIFLFPIAVLLPIGLYQALKDHRRALNVVLALGLISAPLAVALVAEQRAIFRGLCLLPFVILLATAGVHAIWTAQARARLRPLYLSLSVAAVAVGLLAAAWTFASQSRASSSALPLIAAGVAVFGIGWLIDRTKTWRPIAICLLAIVPLQFAGFWSDYFSDYRLRSAYWLGGNIRGAIEAVLDLEQRQQAPKVYVSALRSGTGSLDGRDSYIDAYWQFYLTKLHRLDLRARMAPFDPAALADMPKGSLVFGNVGNGVTDPLVAKGELKQVLTIPEIDGTTFFAVLQR
jgi:4-amino-4-deoxy-L-arabinose transferase-like glycosyltransferase